MKNKLVLFFAILAACALALFSFSDGGFKLQSISKFNDIAAHPPNDGHYHDERTLKITNKDHNTLYLLPIVNNNNLDMTNVPKDAHFRYKTTQVPIYPEARKEIGMMVVAYDVELIETTPLDTHRH